MSKSSDDKTNCECDTLTLEDFQSAYKAVKEVTLPTPLKYSELLSAQTGAEVYLKPENMQYTGAYKLRGAYYKISTLTDEQRERGLISASAGNHAQGVAYAAKKYGCKATIVMPTMTPLIKVNRTKSYGADVVLAGDVYDDAYAHARKLADEKGYTFIHPFDDLVVATGQGTIAMEIIEELPDVDYILVPVGGGGLITGISTCAKLMNPNIKVVGVEPAPAPSMLEALKSGGPVTLLSAATIADGTAVKRVGGNIFPLCAKNIHKMLLVDDASLVDTFLFMVENHKMVVENSGLLSVAALPQLDLKGKKVVCVLSGGNMDVSTMVTVIQNGLIRQSRLFTVALQIPDKAGELCKLASIIGEAKGNITKLEHNQFVNVNRSLGVEVYVTIEAYGVSHRNDIMEALSRAGFKAKLTETRI